jgi:aspartate/methionine/tyrosine aminotransferase
MALCGPGDEVIIPAPYWPSYPEMAILCGAKPVIVSSSIDDKFLIDPKKLEDAITPRTKMMIFCNPSNPTGSVHSLGRMKEIASVLEKHPQVAVLSDEIYERLLYTKEPHISFAALPGMWDRTLTVNGFSKAYAMTGLRLGYLAAPKKVIGACTVIQSQVTSCAGSLSQAAGVAALTLVPEEEMSKNVEVMKTKRDYVVKRLAAIEGVRSFVPEGAFYVLPDVSSWKGGNDTELCLDLLKKKKLALVPGTSFGAPGTVRLSYATSMEELVVAMDKLTEYLLEEGKT